MDDLATLAGPALGARIVALAPDLDRMQLPACILDRALRYRYVNAAYLAYFGRESAASFVGKTADEAFNVVPTDGRRDQIRRALDGETVVFDRSTIEGPYTGRWTRAHYLPVHDGDRVAGVLVMLVDIQHLKDVEGDLEHRERQLALLNENVGVPMSYIDADWRFRYSNQPGLDWVPGGAGNVVGKHLEEVFAPAAFAVIRPNLQRAFQGEKVVYEREGTRCDGSRQWIRVHLVPDQAADGTVRGVYTIVIDVDEDHRLRDALLEQEAQLRFFAENIPGPIAYVDAELRYRFVNNVFLRLRGLDYGDVIGRSVHDVLGAELARKYFDPYVERLRRGEVCEYERLVATPGGAARWHLVRLVPQMGAQSRFEGYYIVGTDVHDLKVAQERLSSAQEAVEAKERQLREVIDAIPTPMCYCDAEGCYRYVNQSFLDYIGLPATRVVGHSVEELLGEERWKEFQPSLERVRAGESVAMERRVRFADGRRRWMNVRLTPRLDAHGRYQGYFSTTSDIHDQKLVEKELRRANAVLSAHLENTPLGVIELDTAMRVVRWSGQAEEIFGWSSAEVLGRNLADWRFIYEEDVDAVSRQVRRLVEGNEPHTTLVHRNYRSDGTVIWVEWHNSALRGEDGRVISLLSLAQDVSGRMQAEERLLHMATHDGLTNVPNRVVLNDRLGAALARSRRSGHNTAVMFLDLDRFKDVNDTLGHRVGDVLLRDMAQRLRAALRQSDLIARISGDEFVLVLEDLPRDETPDRVASKILEEARRPFLIDGNEVHVSASLGVALFPEDGDDAETLLKNADAAMYAAKELGRNSFRLYSPDLAARRTRRLEVETALRRALKDRQLLLHYQPIMDLAGGAVTRAEALLRWNDPVQGLQMPISFLAIAEESGLAHELGSWVLEEACGQARAWRDAGVGPVVVSVNLSPAQLRDCSMLPDLRRILAATGCEPSWLELEITETNMVRDLEGMRHTLSTLRDLGVRVAIDDFGTGFSSLSHLRHLPVDVLKIDQSFIADIEASATGEAKSGTSGAAIVASVLGLARGLGLEVVAEGIEQPSQLAFLTREGCPSGQGYLLCPPLSSADFETWYRARMNKGSATFIQKGRNAALTK